LSSSLSEGLLQVRQLLSSSKEQLVIITDRSMNITVVNETVSEAFQEAEVRVSQSEMFEQERLSDNMTANDINTQLRHLEELLQQEHSFLLNVTLAINCTSLDNNELASKLHSLEVLLYCINLMYATS